MAGSAGQVVVRPLAVLYACAGCSEFGFAAPRVAQALDEQGLVEAIWLGASPPPARVVGRYPIDTLDACAKGCARDWVHARGGNVESAFVLQPLEREDTEAAATRIASNHYQQGHHQP